MLNLLPQNIPRLVSGIIQETWFRQQEPMTGEKQDIAELLECASFTYFSCEKKPVMAPGKVYSAMSLVLTVVSAWGRGLACLCSMGSFL